jgi:leucine dehydrogenase
VGYYLAEFLHKEGAKLFVSDIRAERVHRCVQEFGAEAVNPEKIYDIPAPHMPPEHLSGHRFLQGMAACRN